MKKAMKPMNSATQLTKGNIVQIGQDTFAIITKKSDYSICVKELDASCGEILSHCSTLWYFSKLSLTFIFKLSRTYFSNDPFQLSKTPSTFGFGTSSQASRRSVRCSISRTECRYSSSLVRSLAPSPRRREAVQSRLQLPQHPSRPSHLILASRPKTPICPCSPRWKTPRPAPAG